MFNTRSDLLFSFVVSSSSGNFMSNEAHRNGRCVGTQWKTIERFHHIFEEDSSQAS